MDRGRRWRGFFARTRGDRARAVERETHPEQRLLEELSAHARGGVLGEGRPDLHLVLGAELARGGHHRVTELLLGVGTGGAEHGGDARGGVARGDARGDARGAKVRGGHGGRHLDRSRVRRRRCRAFVCAAAPWTWTGKRDARAPSTWRPELPAMIASAKRDWTKTVLTVYPYETCKAKC